ncbi:MAG: hypothetical protein ACTHQQ_09445 [Solirubrobacteraceae bacterium]
MRRFHIALLAGLATLAFGVVNVAAASANGSSVPPTVASIPALKTVHVHGQAKNGKQFKGTYAIQRFVAGTHKAFAVGTLKGTLNGHHVTRYNVKMPAALLGPGKSAQAAQTCTVLHLTLGPIDLNLLGLRVQLFGGTNAANPQPITLLITADPSGGLLGQLLCNLTNSLGGGGGILGQLNSNLQQLVGVLTSLTSILGAL